MRIDWTKPVQREDGVWSEEVRDCSVVGCRQVTFRDGSRLHYNLGGASTSNMRNHNLKSNAEQPWEGRTRDGRRVTGWRKNEGKNSTAYPFEADVHDCDRQEAETYTEEGRYHLDHSRSCFDIVTELPTLPEQPTPEEPMSKYTHNVTAQDVYGKSDEELERIVDDQGYRIIDFRSVWMNDAWLSKDLGHTVYTENVNCIGPRLILEKKQPEPIVIQVGKWPATVTSEGIKVGCTTLDAAKVEEVYQAFQKMRGGK